MNPAALVEPLLVSAAGPMRRAVRGGLAADAVGLAFQGGYRAAVDALVPGTRDGALAATEDGPLHPRAITTTFTDGVVTGRKRFVTGVPGASELVVLATAGREGDRQRLVAVVVAADAPGVSARRMEPLPFVPEVPHAEVTFDGARALRTVPGDGWADVVRPFRTVEDVHVMAALAAFLIGAAPRVGFARDEVGALCGSLASLITLSGADPADAGVHVALGGALAAFERVVDGLTWDRAEPDEVARWKRDRPLLAVASRARAARLEAAWARLEGR